MTDYEAASVHKAGELLTHLIAITTGPAEAFATICLLIHMLSELNAEQNGVKPPPVEDLIAELSTSIRSIPSLSQRTH